MSWFTDMLSGFGSPVGLVGGPMIGSAWDALTPEPYLDFNQQKKYWDAQPSFDLTPYMPGEMPPSWTRKDIDKDFGYPPEGTPIEHPMDWPDYVIHMNMSPGLSPTATFAERLARAKKEAPLYDIEQNKFIKQTDEYYRKGSKDPEMVGTIPPFTEGEFNDVLDRKSFIIEANQAAQKKLNDMYNAGAVNKQQYKQFSQMLAPTNQFADDMLDSLLDYLVKAAKTEKETMRSKFRI